MNKTIDDKSKTIDKEKIATILKIGIIGAFINFIGDILLGWVLSDPSLTGVEKDLSPYLAMSDQRLFWSSTLGLVGCFINALCFYGIYLILKPYSKRYSNLYRIGSLGYLGLAPAGVHVGSLAFIFFYKYMTMASPANALDWSFKFVGYFLLPIYIACNIFWIIQSYGYIRGVSTGHSPFPRWAWVFSSPIAAIFIAFIARLIGDYPWTNALAASWMALGNIWMFAGNLYLLNKYI